MLVVALQFATLHNFGKYCLAVHGVALHWMASYGIALCLIALHFHLDSAAVFHAVSFVLHGIALSCPVPALCCAAGQEGFLVAVVVWRA